MQTSEELPLARSSGELMAFVQQTRTELEATVSSLDEARLTGVKDHAGWSVKDHLAHVVAWEQVLLRGLSGLPEHEAFQMTAEQLAAAGSTDGINTILHERTRAASLTVVLDDFRRSHEQIVRLLSTMSDADLVAPYAADDARPRIQKIAGDTYQHYAEHTGWIAEMLA